MRIPSSIRVLSLALGLSFIATAPAHAESDLNVDLTTVATPLTATADVDFRITIPKILYLRVGTGTVGPLADNTAVNLIDFVGTGFAGTIAATATSGDLGNGDVTTQVFGNKGDITLTSTTTGALTNAEAETISWSQISTTVSGNVAHPDMVDGATSAALTLTPTVGNVVNRSGVWTYEFIATGNESAGIYGGVNTQNSRVTYTASML